MNIDHIESTRRAFCEIGILYTLFEKDPILAMTILETNPEIKRRTQAKHLARREEFSKMNKVLKLPRLQPDGTFKTVDDIPADYQSRNVLFGEDITKYVYLDRVQKLDHF